MEYKIDSFSNYTKPYIHNFIKYKNALDRRIKEFNDIYIYDIETNFNVFFSFTPIPFECLMKINIILKTNQIENIYDFGAGTGYHSFLFSKILKYNVESYDIQLDNFKNKWYEVQNKDCNDLILKPSKKIIILSWIENKKMIKNILQNNKPEFIMLIGIYYRCPYTYEIYNDLIENQELIEEFIIKEFDSKDNQKISIIKMKY
jgi:hypothetical protein